MAAPLSSCPRCGFEQPQAAECARCGIVFAKWSGPRDSAQMHRAPPVTAAAAEENAAERTIGAAEIRIIATGLALATVAYILPPTRFIFSAMVTLFHELGHAVAAWIMGHPALPAFDLVYGGGITHYGAFRLSIVIAIAALLGWAGWAVRSHRGWLSLVLAAAAFWLFFVSSSWRRELLMASAGHVAEFILAGIFFYRALANVGWRSPGIERPLGAFIAFFVQIHSMLFARRLRADAGFLSWYREGKGGALMNDLESIALDLRIHTSFAPTIEEVAGALLLFSLVPIGAALAWYLFRARLLKLAAPLLVERAG
jgi:hypothetical protein